jgi:hypothetical protein
MAFSLYCKPRFVTGEMTMPELDLAAAIKMAKSKKMRFAFVLKGSDGKLILAKGKIPPKQIAEARSEMGGGTLVTGKCTGPLNNLVFQVVKPPPSTLAAVLKKVVKNEAGLTIAPEVQLAADADTEEPEDGADTAAGAAPAAPGQAAPPPIAALNLGPWQAARQNAITDLKLLATKVATTKHGRAVGVLKEINLVIKKLPTNPTAQEIDKLKDFISNDEAITAAEKVPAHFHDLNIREPLLKALEAMRK